MASASDDGVICVYCKCTEFTVDLNLGPGWIKCRNCGVSQPVERKDLSIRGELLDSHYERTIGEELANRSPRIEGADEVAFIKQHIEGSLDMKIIDLGTATGDFLPSLRALGHNVIGIDKFRPYAAYGAKHDLPIHHFVLIRLAPNSKTASHFPGRKWGKAQNYGLMYGGAARHCREIDPKMWIFTCCGC